MKAIPYLLAGCLSGWVTSGLAQSLVINASAAGDLQHRFAPWLYSSETQSATAPTPAVTLRDYNAITMIFNAPAGYAWQTDNDIPNTANSLRVQYAYGTKPTDASVRRIDYSFDFLPGMGATVWYSDTDAWVSDTGFGFLGGFIFKDAPSGNVAFSSFSITLHAAPGVDPFPLDPFTQASLGFYVTGMGVPQIDPGPRVSLVPVPEPGTGALVGLAGVVWIGRRKLI